METQIVLTQNQWELRPDPWSNGFRRKPSFVLSSAQCGVGRIQSYHSRGYLD
jgi:hypothetical protein